MRMHAPLEDCPIHCPIYEKTDSNPRKHESCPDLPGFPRPIESDQPTAQVCRCATASVATTANVLRFHDKLTVPDIGWNPSKCLGSAGGTTGQIRHSDIIGATAWPPARGLVEPITLAGDGFRASQWQNRTADAGQARRLGVNGRARLDLLVVLSGGRIQ
jgi:hypothetical protein